MNHSLSLIRQLDGWQGFYQWSHASANLSADAKKRLA